MAYKKLSAVAVVGVGAFLLGAGARLILADTTWTGPSATPPGGNVDAPLNVGSSIQTKTGGLRLGQSLAAPVVAAGPVAPESALSSTVLTAGGKIQVRGGNPQSGYVLTAEDTDGNAKWAPSVPVPSGEGNVLTYQNGTMVWRPVPQQNVDLPGWINPSPAPNVTARVPIADQWGNVTWQLFSMPSGGSVGTQSSIDLEITKDTNCGSCTFSVTFPRSFAAHYPIAVVLTSHWQRQTKDEGSIFSVESVTATGFVIRVHTPHDGTVTGEDGVSWVATGWLN